MYADLIIPVPAPACTHNEIYYNPFTRLYECKCGKTWTSIDNVRDYQAAQRKEAA